MAAKPTEAVFLGIKVDGVMYQIGDDDMPDKVHEKLWQALFEVYDYKRFMAEKGFAG